ncbi:MAG: hypothetical protein GEU73_14450 [Chloroflexi bacterium]|nr:hypothetical protein [Chloroflexota bacterium]
MPFSGTETVYGDLASTSGIGLGYMLYNYGQAPAPVRLKIKNLGPPELRRVHVGTYNGPGLADFLNATRWAQMEATGRGWTVTLSGSTASVADANASGGNVAETSYASTGMLTRVRMERSTNLDTLAGRRFDVYVRLRTTVTGDTHNIGMETHIGTASMGQQTSVFGPVTGSGTAQYVWHKAGTLAFPSGALSTIEFFFKSSADDTAARLRWDAMYLFPTQCRFGGSGLADQGLGVNGSFVTDPENHRVEILDDSDLVISYAKDHAGPVPLRVPPGLTLVTFLFETEGAEEATHPATLLSQNATVSWTASPRHYS